MNPLNPKTVLKLACLFFTIVALAGAPSDEKNITVLTNTISFEETVSRENSFITNQSAYTRSSTSVHSFNKNTNSSKRISFGPADYALYSTFKYAFVNMIDHFDHGNWSFTMVFNAYLRKFRPLLHTITCFLKMITNYGD